MDPKDRPATTSDVEEIVTRVTTQIVTQAIATLVNDVLPKMITDAINTTVPPMIYRIVGEVVAEIVGDALEHIDERFNKLEKIVAQHGKILEKHEKRLMWLEAKIA